VKNQPTSHLNSFAGHLDKQYGKPDTPAHEEFEEGFEKFKLDAIVQNPPENKSDNL
jgi:HTH-type transcriptional regulator/antitoxin HipB